jgi:gamma-glutamyltranspeptidase/glutathione hydrolase
MMASFAAEPALTSLGAGGYMLVATPEGEDVLLDFFVEAPGRGADGGPRAELIPVTISFGDADQVFNVGPAACGPYGTPAGICAAHERFATLPLAELAAPAVALARDGVAVNAEQSYIFEILDPIFSTTAEGRALLRSGDAIAVEGDVLAQPDLADALERLAAEGDAPFYTGDIAAAVCEWVTERGGLLGPQDLAAYRAIPREPIGVGYRGRTVRINPPPNAGGILVASALRTLDAEAGPPPVARLVDAMQAAQAARTPQFVDGLAREGFIEDFLGSTTHISVIDANGMACSVTCTNGAGSAVIVPGTGIHLNNMMGEADLSPFGFFTYAPGRRLPSMMAPTVVRGADGDVELALGSAGSSRIRSAILQVVSAVIDHGMPIDEAVRAPRLHWEDGMVYAEPGLDLSELEAAGHTVAWFRGLNVFFGGCQAVRRDAAGELHGAGDPRRGGAVVSVEA